RGRPHRARRRGRRDRPPRPRRSARRGRHAGPQRTQSPSDTGSAVAIRDLVLGKTKEEKGDKGEMDKRAMHSFMAVMLAAAPLAAQEPTPAPTPNPAPVAIPAPTPAPAMAAPAPVWAPMAAGGRRGWFGISLSCEECFIQRSSGRVAYIQ